jgi:hypothetical protein
VTRIGIMQPYFFPYLGYFALIEHCDTWVVFDVTQYTPKTWMNRNRVLHPEAGWNWVTVPLANSSNSITIDEARVLDRRAARASVLGKLSHYRRRAPYWRAVEGLVEQSFDAALDDALVDLDVAGLAAVCAYLGLDFAPLIASELRLDLPAIDHPGGWAPAIAHALGASRYLNPIGGRELFHPSEFEAVGVALEFLEPPTLEYDPAPFAYVPDLSILDVLMWNHPSAVRQALATARVDAVVAPR